MSMFNLGSLAQYSAGGESYGEPGPGKLSYLVGVNVQPCGTECTTTVFC